MLPSARDKLIRRYTWLAMLLVCGIFGWGVIWCALKFAGI